MSRSVQIVSILLVMAGLATATHLLHGGQGGESHHPQSHDHTAGVSDTEHGSVYNPDQSDTHAANQNGTDVTHSPASHSGQDTSNEQAHSAEDQHRSAHGDDTSHDSHVADHSDPDHHRLEPGQQVELASGSEDILAPGYRSLAYDAPIPGSYNLPSLGTADDGVVLDTDGNSHNLVELVDGKITLLAFIYANCNDVNGCPLTDLVFRQVQSRLAEQPAFRDQLQIYSLSFDPDRDTPQSLSALQKSVAVHPQPGWRYLTTSGSDQLNPILDAYQQSVIAEVDSDGNETGYLSHIMRVFLIDQRSQIRNIYSTSFLHAETLESDIKTLILESGNSTEQMAQQPLRPQYRSGDVKTGYSSAAYTTQSQALISRVGKPLDLIAHANKKRAGLGPVPNAEALDQHKVALGRRLFYDRRLSLNDTQSCAICHIPEQGFTSNELSMAVGFEGRTVRRNAPTVLNVAYLERLFHDGREFSLENQIWAPLFARNEMAIPSPGYLLRKLESIDGYPQAFNKAFGEDSITMDRIGIALASYQRTLVAANSPFDRWFFENRPDAISADAQAGFKVFSGKAGCIACHTVSNNVATFSNSGMHNTGVGYTRSMFGVPDTTRVLLAPGVHIDIDRASYDAAAEDPPADLGLYEITQDPKDRWKYRTPTLRNVALTAPYMHDGSLKTLAEVVDYYDKGGEPNEVLDPLIRPLQLTADEKQQLVAFLESLTSPEVNLLVEDAFSAPIGDVGKRWQEIAGSL